jgi:hypothetical protein
MVLGPILIPSIPNMHGTGGRFFYSNLYGITFSQMGLGSLSATHENSFYQIFLFSLWEFYLANFLSCK